MSFLNRLMARSKLNNAIGQTAKAQKADGEDADKLFQVAHASYGEISGSKAVMADTFYQWGLAFLHQAQAKSGEEAIKFYQDAGGKFSACVGLKPEYVDALIDWGVALMGQARESGFDVDHLLYDQANEKFLQADTLFPGGGSYNLACIRSLRGDHEACLEFLETARDRGHLPETDQIMSDPDIANALEQGWFQTFLESLEEEEEEEVTDEESGSDSDSESETKT